jgi:hypothetical protein
MNHRVNFPNHIDLPRWNVSRIVVKRIFTHWFFTLALLFAAFPLNPFQYIQANELSVEPERDADASENILRPKALHDRVGNKGRNKPSNSTFVRISDIPSARTSLRSSVSALNRQGFLADLHQLHGVLRI